jgi:hypothetical protein
MTERTQKDIATEQWRHHTAEPFAPAGLGRNSAELRAAHALEYIAAQMGEINAKLSKLLKLSEFLEKPRDKP